MADKYDYRVLLQEAYNRDNNFSILFRDRILKILEDDKPNISSVFGVGPYPEFELPLCVFVGDAKIWKEDGYRADAEDDSDKILMEIGLSCASDGIFKVDSSDEISIVEKLIAIGFEYDEKFEFFMMDV